MLKVLYIGDVSGSVGREVMKEVLPKVRSKHNPDIVIANVENAAGGYGINKEVVDELLSYGVDLATGGDHTFSIRDFFVDIQLGQPIIRPANYEGTVPGVGHEIIDLGEKGRVGVVQFLGRELFNFAQKVHNPFLFAEEYIKKNGLLDCDALIVEFHAESTAEKLTFAWSLRGFASAVVGTHTHVATADNRVLGDHEGKLLYVSDIGQVGPYAASLWVDFEVALYNFKNLVRLPHAIATTGPRIFNSVLLTFDRQNRERYSPLKIERVDIVVD
jgi:metallophosphoesterase (TIGR00282 family)